VTAAERWVYDRRDEHLAAVVDVDEEYDRYLTEKARAWREGIPSCCAICLKPTEPSYDLCPTCEHDEDVSAEHYRRDFG
jgi:hypothetical protein